MALTSSAVFSPSNRILVFKSLPFGSHRPTRGHVSTCSFPPPFSVKSPRMSLFSEPQNFKANVNHVMQKLGHSVPDAVHNFPWKEAEGAAIKRLVVTVQETLKWSLSALFILSCISDTIYSITRNKELLIPFGFFFGCMAADFLRETTRELFQYSEERGTSEHLLWIGSFFVIVKIFAMYFFERPTLFLHAASGGIIQLLWRWKAASESEAGNETSS